MRCHPMHPATLVLLLAAALPAGADTVCRQVDADGRVQFTECARTGGAPAESVEVEAPLTGANLGAGLPPAGSQAAHPRAESRTPPRQVNDTGRREPPRTRREEQEMIAALEKECAVRWAADMAAARERKVQECVDTGREDEAACRHRLRDWGAPVRNRHNGTIHRQFPLPAACAQLNEARANRRFR